MGLQTSKHKKVINYQQKAIERIQDANRQKACQIKLLEEQNKFMARTLAEKRKTLYIRKVASSRDLITDAALETDISKKIRKLEQRTSEKLTITKMMNSRYKSLSAVHTHLIVGKSPRKSKTFWILCNKLTIIDWILAHWFYFHWKGWNCSPRAGFIC